MTSAQNPPREERLPHARNTGLHPGEKASTRPVARSRGPVGRLVGGPRGAAQLGDQQVHTEGSPRVQAALHFLGPSPTVDGVAKRLGGSARWVGGWFEPGPSVCGVRLHATTLSGILDIGCVLHWLQETTIDFPSMDH